jgi:hypothetical protein
MLIFLFRFKLNCFLLLMIANYISSISIFHCICELNKSTYIVFILMSTLYSELGGFDNFWRKF